MTGEVAATVAGSRACAGGCARAPESPSAPATTVEVEVADASSGSVGVEMGTVNGTGMGQKLGVGARLGLAEVNCNRKLQALLLLQQHLWNLKLLWNFSNVQNQVQWLERDQHC